MIVPKTIHIMYMWEPAPEWANQNVAEFAEMNPDYDIDFVDHVPDDLPPELLERAMQAPTPRFRSDLIRYWLLRERGGVYVDADCRPVRPFGDINLADGATAFCTCYRGHETIPDNFFIGGTPGSLFWDAAVKSCLNTEPFTLPAAWFGAINVYGEDWASNSSLDVLPAGTVLECAHSFEFGELVSRRPIADPASPAVLKHYRAHAVTERSLNRWAHVKVRR